MFSWMIWDVWLVRIYKGSFFKLFITLENDETVNFLNCRKSFSNKFAAFFVAFWHPIFKREKRNEVTMHMKHAAMAVAFTLGKLVSLQEDSDKQNE